jgi:hypothetical protein
MNGALRTDPVIVLGMHHSGTGILARILHENGVFMHADMAHYESRFFSIEVNDRLLLGSGDAWARTPIAPVKEIMLRVDDAKALIAAKGLRRYARAGYDGGSPWGFKDPRVCVLLPLYMELYPEARLIHIVRTEDDVAASLARAKKSGAGRITDPEHWRALRTQYVARALAYGRRHSHYHELQYEELCSDPEGTGRPLLAYLGIPFTDATAAYLRATVRQTEPV